MRSWQLFATVTVMAADGGAWGGEILHCNLESTEFARLGHLESQPLLGGDLASRYPLRLAAGILQKSGVNVEDWLIQKSNHLPHGEIEAKLILQQLKVGKDAIETTSCGQSSGCGCGGFRYLF